MFPDKVGFYFIFLKYILKSHTYIIFHESNWYAWSGEGSDV